MLNENQAILLKVCRMYCSPDTYAEDLFQEIVLQLWKTYPTFRGASKRSTWVYRVALNTAISSLRKSTHRPKFQELSLKQDAISQPDSQRLDIQYDGELQKAIHSLDKLDKGLVMLYLEEKSYKEIAEILGLSESNVAVKINRVKKKLKEKINP